MALKDVKEKKVVATAYRKATPKAMRYLKGLKIGEEVALSTDISLELDDFTQRKHDRAWVLTPNGEPCAYFSGEFGDLVSGELYHEPCFRAFTAEPTAKQKQGSLRLNVVGGLEVTADELERYLKGERPPPRPATRRTHYKSRRIEGKSYSRKELVSIYRKYAKLKNWNVDAEVVDDKVDAWLDSTLGAVGLALTWHETGEDPKPDWTRPAKAKPEIVEQGKQGCVVVLALAASLIVLMLWVI